MTRRGFAAVYSRWLRAQYRERSRLRRQVLQKYDEDHRRFRRDLPSFRRRRRCLVCRHHFSLVLFSIAAGCWFSFLLLLALAFDDKSKYKFNDLPPAWKWAFVFAPALLWTCICTLTLVIEMCGDCWGSPGCAGSTGGCCHGLTPADTICGPSARFTNAFFGCSRRHRARDMVGGRVGAWVLMLVGLTGIVAPVLPALAAIRSAAGWPTLTWWQATLPLDILLLTVMQAPMLLDNDDDDDAPAVAMAALVVSAALTCVPVLASLVADGILSCGYWVSVTPLCGLVVMLGIAMLGFTLFLACTGAHDVGEAAFITAGAWLLMIVPFVLAFLTPALRADGIINWRWTSAFAPSLMVAAAVAVSVPLALAAASHDGWDPAGNHVLARHQRPREPRKPSEGELRLIASRHIGIPIVGATPEERILVIV